MEVKDLTDIEGIYLTGGGVSFQIKSELPKWPESCVVCGKYCVETCEFPSRRGVTYGRFRWTARGLRSFMVPVHKTQGPCLARLRQPIPVWGWFIPLMAGLGGGVYMSHLALPPDRLVVFCVFGAIFAAVALVPLIFMFPTPLEILEGPDGGYFASFKDAQYARRFAALNRQE